MDCRVNAECGFDYLATNINLRDAEFERDVKFILLQHLKRIAYLLLSNSRLRSFVLCALCDSAVLFRNHKV
jgi:hypothetical protein